MAKGGQYVTLLLLTLTLNFFLPRWMPGTPLRYLAGEDVASLSPPERQVIMDRYGLNLSLVDQFGIYLRQLAQGDLGYSHVRQKPIRELVMHHLPWTLLPVGLGLILSTAVGITLGAMAAWRRGRNQDMATLVLFVVMESMPSFWVGMLLVTLFAIQLRWLPAAGALTPWVNLTGWPWVRDVLWHLVLPVTTQVLTTLFAMYLTMRAALMAVLEEDYVLMARAKGLREHVVLFRHALRNALLPVATTFMLRLGYVLSGSAIIESVFGYPGLGGLLAIAVRSRDYPVMQAVFLITTLAILTANLLADLLYPLLDPRIARGGATVG